MKQDWLFLLLILMRWFDLKSKFAGLPDLEHDRHTAVGLDQLV